jgi:hypothetical protein
MIRPPIDQDNVMSVTDFTAQIRGRDDASAAASQYYDLLSPVASSHAGDILFTQILFCIQVLARTDSEPL